MGASFKQNNSVYNTPPYQIAQRDSLGVKTFVKYRGITGILTGGLMSKKIGVILSGCGRMDGSEIKEAVLTLLALDKANMPYQCLAPNLLQHTVMNHHTGEAMPNESRNMLIEAARIPHTSVLDLAQENPLDFSALIFPGGLGACKNLSNFAEKKEKATVLPIVRTWIEAMIQHQRPVGFICIAPTMIPLLYPQGVQMTIGSDISTAKVMTNMGAIHVPCAADNIVIDTRYKVASTPAYMVAKNIAETAIGIEKLVQQIIAWTKQ